MTRDDAGLRISDGLVLPLDTVTSTLVVYGGKGMGKTNLLSVVLEEMSKARLRWCALDPVGVLWGLRHGADGQGPGIECLILGGVHGDIPVYPDSGEIVADLVADHDISVVVDCSRNAQGQMWSVGERTRFLTAFARRIFQRQGSLVDGRRREPLFVALDEAARYIPEQIPAGNPDLSWSVGAWEQPVEEGRNVGIGVGLFTQRSARLKKSVAELADAMLAFRTVGPRSIDAVMNWLGEHIPKTHVRELVEQLRQIAVGTALVVSPGWLRFEGVVAIRARETFDSSETPKPGQQSRRVKGRGAVVDLETYRQRMAETVERAKADDPRELRRQIAELQKELTALRAATPEPAIERVEVPVFDAALADRIKDHLASLVSGVVASAEDILAAVEEGSRGRHDVPRARPAGDAPGALGTRRRTTERPDSPVRRDASRPPVPRVEARRPEGLSGAETKLLTALVHRGPALERRSLGAISGYSWKSGGFRNSLSSLRTKGYLEGSDPVTITDAGRTALGDVAPPPSGLELLQFWQARVGKAEKAIAAVLFEAYPRPMTREQVAEACGYTATSGGFRNALSRLRTLGLVAPGDPLVASEELGGGR